MDPNQQLIKHFYTCFQNMDYHGMQARYAEHAVFSDPIFIGLNAEEAKAMWEMLITGAKDLRIEFSVVSGNSNTVNAHWDAYYTFSKTGNQVINRIDATFEIENHKIVKHADKFNFNNWAKQTLGVIGLLLGRTGFLKNKIRKTARQNLYKFMAKRK